MNHKPSWTVEKVKPTKNYKLIIDFADGVRKQFDFTPLLKEKLYKPLNNLTFFLTAKVSCGTVVWSDDIDIAPEYLYDNSESMDSSNKTYDELITALIALRKNNKITQQALAEICGMPQSAIARIENGSSIPQLDTLIKILDKLQHKLSITPKK